MDFFTRALKIGKGLLVGALVGYVTFVVVTLSGRFLGVAGLWTAMFVIVGTITMFGNPDNRRKLASIMPKPPLWVVGLWTALLMALFGAGWTFGLQKLVVTYLRP
ncbi:MAG TPA: hypothetical protein V6C76_03095 [Drouetiella sp.]